MARTNKTLVGEICLYGNREIGAGWLAQTESTMLGDGEPVVTRTFTSAVWFAQQAIRESGVTSGMVRVYAPGGMRFTTIGVNETKWFGDMKWEQCTAEHFVEVKI